VGGSLRVQILLYITSCNTIPSTVARWLSQRGKKDTTHKGFWRKVYEADALPGANQQEHTGLHFFGEKDTLTTL